MADFVEYMDVLAGPTIRLDFGKALFSVCFSDRPEKWLKDNREIAEGGTVGQANRKYLHDKLEEFLSSLLKEAGNG